MLITVYCVRRDLSEITFSLEVDGDFELENFRALCELESGIPASDTLIVYAERPLTDNQRSLASYGLKDGDVVILRQKEAPETRPAAPFPGLDFSTIAVPGASSQPDPSQPQAPPPPPDTSSFPQGLDNPALLRQMLLANPHELSLLKERNPPLAEALLSGDLEKFTKVLQEQQQERARREQERIRLYSADPFDLDAQAKIEEDIRQHNIEENMTIAMEEAPESFGQVVMLYINCKVNGYPVKAFVDSGAQMTIMSQACAERCHIMRLVDRRWAGIAKGVGTQKIIGRVHLAQVQIEGDFLPCSFSILEEQPMDMLLGLDMLKRHQCSIDLEKNVLVIGTTGTRTTFLPEGELPECARLAYGPGREEVPPEEIADRELAEVLQKSADEADMETTSLKVPSLVSPTDGLDNHAHASGTTATPPAHSVTPQTTDRSLSPTVTDSIEPCKSACKGATSSPQGHLTQAEPSPLPVESLGPCKTSGDPETPPLVCPDQASELLLELPVHSHVQQEMDLAGEAQQLTPTQAFSLTQDHAKDVEREHEHSSLGGGLSEATEATMEVEASSHCNERSDEASGQSIYSPPTQLHGDQTPGQSSAEEQMLSGSMTLAVDLQLPQPLSEMPDSTTEVICPLPPSTTVPDGEDRSFSLATALKELHKLLVTSGEGPCRTLADEKSTSPLDTNPDDKRNNLSGLPCQSSSNKPMSIYNSVLISVRDNVVSDEKLLSEPEEGIEGQDVKSPEQLVLIGECATSTDVELQRTKVETITDSEAGAMLDACHVPSVSDISLMEQEAGSSEETIMEAGSGEETIMEAGSGEETIMEAGSGEETIMEAGSGEETIMEAGTYGETIMQAGTDEKTMEEAGTSEETIMEAGTDEETIMEAAIGEETVMEAGIGEGTIVDAGTGEETGTQSHSSCDQPLPIELPDPQSVPAVGASSLFAPSDIEQIVSAGFTMQDAILALEKADGHAEVALLALLAKKITVPT
ncbi:protein DDI1 homolog 2 isoform X2 [Xenopus laevis]|uniref:Protein DDI1 homolog 2 n=1 Tax=Xenopus laevis TaxID=8355 RepID=A0A8J1L8F7_XENLA|nr:protein DDI1 homolog 2 isoform X2 [Xenopus laevis]